MRALVVGLIVVLSLLPLGCSAVREISEAAFDVKDQAQGVRIDIAAAKDTGEVGPRAGEFLDAADAKAVAIQEQASKIVLATTRVEDKTSPWVGVLWWLAVAASILGALGLCVYLGIPAIAKPVLAIAGGWLTWLIPTPTATTAKLDAEAAAAGKLTPEHDKTITVRRASDPAYNSVFSRVLTKARAMTGGGGK